MLVSVRLLFDQWTAGKKVIFNLGQIINAEEDIDKPSESSLDQRFSDVVGESSFALTDNLKLNYNFNIDQNYKDFVYNDISADLITDVSKRLVNADKTADRLFGVQTFTSSVNVNSDSSLLTVSFGVNQASGMWMENQGNPNEYNARAIGSGPFSTYMTVE